MDVCQSTFLLKDTFILNSVSDPAVPGILKLVCVEVFSTNMNVSGDKDFGIQLRLNYIMIMGS